MKTQDDIFALCDQIRETSFSLHRYLRHGHLEKVYENGLAHQRDLGTSWKRRKSTKNRLTRNSFCNRKPHNEMGRYGDNDGIFQTRQKCARYAQCRRKSDNWERAQRVQGKPTTNPTITPWWTWDVSTQPLTFDWTENPAKARIRADSMLLKPDIVEIVQLISLCPLFPFSLTFKVFLYKRD